MATLLNIEKPLSRSKITMTREDLKRFIREVVDTNGEDYLSNYGDVYSLGYEKLLDKTVNKLYDYHTNDADMIEDIYVTSRMDFDEFHNGLTDKLGYDGIGGLFDAYEIGIYTERELRGIIENFSEVADEEVWREYRVNDFQTLQELREQARSRRASKNNNQNNRRIKNGEGNLNEIDGDRRLSVDVANVESVMTPDEKLTLKEKAAIVKKNAGTAWVKGQIESTNVQAGIEHEAKRLGGNVDTKAHRAILSEFQGFFFVFMCQANYRLLSCFAFSSNKISFICSKRTKAVCGKNITW